MVNENDKRLLKCRHHFSIEKTLTKLYKIRLCQDQDRELCFMGPVQMSHAGGKRHEKGPKKSFLRTITLFYI